jgi:hypothetical protein
MAPRHGEIIKDIGNGWAIAWDTTRVDKRLSARMNAVVRKQSTALSDIIAGKSSKSDKRSGPWRSASGSRGKR